MNVRNRHQYQKSNTQIMSKLSRLALEGAIIPVIPWWGTLEHDNYMENQLYLDSIHQDINVNQFHDGESFNIPYGLSH